MASRIYYNARLSSAHNNGTTPSAPIPIAFSDLRPTEIVRKASDYVLSIVRFTTTLQGLPQLIVEHPNSTAAQPTATSYVFYLTSGNVTIEAPVVWSPADASLRQSTGNLGDPYWYEYSYIRFGTLVNAALSTAMDALNAAVPALSGAPAPFFSYDPASATWSLYQPMAALTPTFTLAANSHAAHLFDGFPMVRSSSNRVTFLAVLQPDEQPLSFNGFSYVGRTQTPGALTNWSPIRRFVFTSTLPVAPELTIPATPYGTSGQTLSTNATMSLITDLTPVTPRGDELSFGTLEYTPTAEFRRIALMSDVPVNEIAFSVFWEDNLGGLHQMYLYENGFVSVKILLEKVK